MANSRPAREGMVTDEPRFPLLRLEDLVKNPALLEPPPVVLPHLAWEERVTLLAAPEKSGKSTLVGQGVAAIATGQFFLDAVPQRAKVLWLALDEPLGDLVRRLRAHGAQRDVFFFEQTPPSETLERTIRETGVRLVVIDTLSEFAAGYVADANAATDWVLLLRKLRAILKGTGCACILLHHSTKASEGGRARYRDSSQIGAGVDVIVEMSKDADDDTVRKCWVRGRVKADPFNLRYVDPHYNLEATGELTLELRIYRAVESRPGLSKRQLRDAVPGKGTTVALEIDRMVRQGVLIDRGDRRASAFYVKNGGNHPGTAWEPLDDKLATSIDTTGNHSGTASGIGGGSHPLKGVVGNHSGFDPDFEPGDAWEPESDEVRR